MALVTDAVVGSVVSILFQEVLQRVQLLAQGNQIFRDLQTLLNRLQKPTNYLIDHEDEAGGSLVHNWLEDLRKELEEAKVLLEKWPKIKRWNLPKKHDAVKNLLRVINNIDGLERSQTVQFASNVRSFGSLDQGVNRLNDGVGKVDAGVERLDKQMDRLGEKVTDFAQTTAAVLAHVRRATLLEDKAEIIKKAYRASGHDSTFDTGSGTPQASETTMHHDAKSTFPDEVFGENDIPDGVVAAILDDDDQPRCIGLWAMGGAGKTFTAGRVYHNPRIQGYFDGPSHRIWITVSRKRSPYSVMEDLFLKLGGQQNQFPAADDTYGVRSALKGLLNRDKLLLVIDDVWEADQLDFMDLISEPEDSKRRVILVTTRHQKILDRKLAKKFEMKLLSEDDSWKLFSRNAFGRAMIPTELRDVARSVAAECKRLPLALKIIGSTMAGETDPKQWEISLQKLVQASVLGKEHEDKVFGRLQLSIDNLREHDKDSRLQHCFYYFAAFPEDEEIEAQQLVNYLRAEGIVGKDPDYPVSADGEAYELLGTLIALSMIEVVQYNSYGNLLTACKIHDVMRDLARYNLKNNYGKNFSMTEKIPARQRLCLYRSGLQSSTFPEDWAVHHSAESTSSTTLLVERLSFMANNLQKLPEQFDAPHLRLLLLRNNGCLKSLSGSFFHGLKQLRVLDLQKTGIVEIPEAVFDIFSLVFLNLDECEFLEQIPASIERLQNLQQLRINSCSKLSFIPKGLRNLKSLKVLDAHETFIWDEPNSSSEENATLQDVACSRALESLSISSRTSSPVPEISELTGLQSLELTTAKWKELPESFTKLVNLRSLRLTCSCTTLPGLDQLQKLEEVYLKSNELESLPYSFVQSGAFLSLQSFHVDCQRLKGPALQPGAMPKVKSFIIERVRTDMEDLSASLQELSTLLYLEISACRSLESLSALSKPNTFPDLKEISLKGSRGLRNLPAGMMTSAPKLRRLVLEATTLSRSDIPEDLLEKKSLQIIF